MDRSALFGVAAFLGLALGLTGSAYVELQGNTCTQLERSCHAWCEANPDDPGGGPTCASHCITFKEQCMSTGEWSSRLTRKTSVIRK